MIRGQKFLVLGVRAYDFQDEKTEKQLRGLKVIYLDEPEDSAMQKGYLPLTAPADFPILGQFDAKPFPSVFELDFRQKADTRTGKPTLLITAAEFVEPVKLDLPQ